MMPAVGQDHRRRPTEGPEGPENHLGAQLDEQSVVRLTDNLAQSVAQRLSVCFAR
jgi:hypothetical protein